MTARTRRSLVVGLIVAPLLAVTTPAIGAERYCGTGSKRTGLTVTTYVVSDINRDGYRVMQTTSLWKRWAKPSYYTCRSKR